MVKGGNIKKVEYYDDGGNLIFGKMPNDRIFCYWSHDGIPCKFLAIKGYWFCQEHKKQMHKINGREFKIDEQVKEALIKNE